MRNNDIPSGKIFAKQVILLSLASKEDKVWTLVKTFKEERAEMVSFPIAVLPLSHVTFSVTLTSISLARVTVHAKLTVEPA